MDIRKIVLLAAAAEIVIVGCIYLFAPAFMMRSNGMTITSVNEFHTIRAAYGGAFVAFGLLFAAGALRPAMTRHALVALAVFMGGFALGRLFSILVDGLPVATFLGVLASEIAFASAALWLLRRETAGGPARAAG